MAIRRVRRRKNTVLNKIKKAGLVLAGTVTLSAGAATGTLVYDQNTGNVSRLIGEHIANNKSHGKIGQYWEGIQEHDEFIARLNGKKIDTKKVEAEFPDSSIVDKWPVTKDNSITILSDDKENNVLVKKEARRYDTDCKDIPDIVKKALTLREDQEFYKHGGINWKGKLRLVKPALGFAFYKISSYFSRVSDNNGLEKKISKLRLPGGSGITEQAAKLIFTDRGKIVSREGSSGLKQKLREMLYAAELDYKYGKNRGEKDRLLCFYANNVYFGDGNYGVEAAAKDYFDKELSELDLGEALFLSVLIQNPKNNPKNGGFEFQFAKYQSLLKSLHNDKKLTDDKYKKYNNKEAIKIIGEKKRAISVMEFPAAVDVLLDELKKKYGIDLLREELNSPDPSFGFTIRTTLRKDEIRRLQAAVDFGLKHDTAQVGAVVLDRDRRIIGAIGRRRNSEIGGLNYLVMEGVKRMPLASLIKPVEYAVGYNEELFTPDEIYNDNPSDLLEPPKNWDNKYDREMSLEAALATSNNVITRKVYDAILTGIGYKRFVEYLENLGFDISQYKGFEGDGSIALGSKGGLNPLGVAAMYSTFYDGSYITPTIINDVEVGDVKIVNLKRDKKTVFRNEVKDAIRKSLLRVGDSLHLAQKGVYAKTGTSNEFRNTWMAGFQGKNSPFRGFAILVTNDDNSPLGDGQYAVKLVGPIASIYLAQVMDKTIYTESPGIIEVIQPEESNEPEVKLEHFVTSLESREEGIIECKYRMEEVKAIYDVSEIDVLLDIRRNMVDCSLGYERGGDEWAKYVLGQGLAADRLNKIYFDTRGKELPVTSFYDERARSAYQEVIESSDNEEITEIAKKRLDEVMDRNGI